MKNILQYLFLLFVGCCGTAAWGQSYNFINYGIGDGLSHEKVLDLCEDKYGNLWIATLGGGLSKYNGREFRSLTIRDGLSSNYIRDILADRQGNIWAATANGISRYDGKNIRNFAVGSDSEKENSVSVILEDHLGDIWFSAPNGGIGKIDSASGSISIFNIPNTTDNDKVIALAEGIDHNIWLISVVKGLYKYDGETFVNVINNADFKGYLRSLYIDNDGTFWLGSNKGLLRFDPKNPSKINDFFPPLNGSFIKSVQVPDTSNFWGVSAFGMIQYDQGKVKSFTEEQGFTNTGVNTLYQDREGTIWIGTDGDGLFKLSNQTFVQYGKRQGLNGSAATSIVQDFKGNYWFSTYGGGVDVFDGKKVVNYGVKEGINNSYISTSTIDKQGNIWMGTRGSGVIKYDGDKFSYLDTDDGLVYNSIRFLFTDSQNNLWVGTVNGLSKYDGKSFENFTTKNGLHDNSIWSISEPAEGKILVVTRRGFSYFTEGELHQGFNEPKVFDKRINVALQDKYDNYWIGYSGHGLLRVDKNRSDYTYIATEEGLASDLIYNMIFDEDGNLIIGSERGVDKLYMTEDMRVSRIKNYGKTEGFEDIQTTHNTMYKDVDGNIWFGAPRGVFKYRQDKEEVNEVEPIIYISGLKLFYQEKDWSKYADSITNWFGLPMDLRLPYDENNLIIEYFGNSLCNPYEVRYKFRLVGLENEWSPATSKSEAVYTNLSPGAYTFEVVASNGDGIWNRHPATFTFEIVPPFWQEIWFFLLTLILAVLGIKFFHDYRVRSNLNRILTVERIRAEELEKVRKRMARDFHDNMGNQLASITVFANLISLKLKNKSEEIDELLKNIEKHTKSLFSGTKDFIWSIDPESDDLGEIFTYIKDFGEDLFNNTEISFFSKADEMNNTDLSLPSGWSRQMVLIFKEGMTNVLKHAKADEVHLELNLYKNEFVIKFMDNGIGLDHEQLGKGNGFKNMKARAAQLNCTVEIKSGIINEKGTAIIFKGSIQSEQREKGIKIY